MKKLVQVVTLCALAGLLTGCAGFRKDWKRAGEIATPQNDITGRWEGVWTSDVNQHTGRLRCLLSKKSETSYEARFYANYKRIFSFEYMTPLRVERTEMTFKFEGEADLGRLAGGDYTYRGAATPEEFFSTYDSKSDHGTFRMKRPAE